MGPGTNPRGVPGKNGWVRLRWECRGCGRSGGAGMHNFLRGGEKGAKWIAGMLDTSSTNHGLTRFTFCSKSGSSQVTCRRSYVRNKITQSADHEDIWFK